jgi:tRNA (guanine37-N1)-methyltransferase
VLRIDVVTIFPDLFGPFLTESFVGIARQRGLAEIAVHDLRAWTTDRHRTVDDTPYGGGPGMVMKPEPLTEAIEDLAGPKSDRERSKTRVILLSPRGRRLDQALLAELAGCPDREDPAREGAEEVPEAEGQKAARLVLVCGRYEGVDQRVIDLAVDQEISIGDYVLSGGEIPAMLLIEGMVRLLPGVLGNPESATEESFQEALLEAPHYTRPAEFRGCQVPEVLRSGNHAAINEWRREQAREITMKRRPDLLDAAHREDER